jgi:hypothetical protein
LNASKLIKAAEWIQTSGNAGHLEGITDIDQSGSKLLIWSLRSLSAPSLR